MNSSIKRFFIGLAMLVAGGYWFLSSVTVRAGLYSLRVGSFRPNEGLVVIPFIVGVIWFFANIKSLGAKILMSAGLLMILASIVAGTRFIFHSTSLYAYLIMLIFIFGGATLVIQFLFQESKEAKKSDELQKKK